MVKVGRSPRGRSRLSFVWILSLVASVWTTPLVMSLIGDQSLLMLALTYATSVTVVGLFLVVRPRKVRLPVAQKKKVLESPQQQLA